ncbi:MAG TPA: DUF3999 domain-containing protein [Dokdonella sp.]|uniref:DUF3999 domain-containing protein n=1 Tax=Dokdonella sp. TaxID=2291710 RepID=UPI002D7F60B2|nr:DUF3999 domain-containing protein [Dokdonella sp.]HET9034280.1 DUF3999 domain-containing protein [Dokdonella sp.]
MKLLALIAVLGMQTAAAASPDNYAMVLPIETDGSSAAWQIELNTEAYHWSQEPNLRDIAIFNAAGQPVPMARWRVEPRQSVEQRTAELPIFALPTEPSTRPDTNLQLIVNRDASGRVQRIETNETGAAQADSRASEWLLDSSDFDEGIDAITLHWSSPETSVVARYDVGGSDDLQTWKRIRSDATIALFERDGLRIERREIELNGQPFRYLRLRRLDNGPVLANLHVEAQRRQHRSEFRQRIQWFDATLVQALGSMQHSDRRHLYSLPASVPVSRLRIDLASDNSLAQLDVSTSSSITSGQHWMHRAGFVAYRLRQAGTEIDSGEIGVSGTQRIDELRIDSATPLSQSPRVRVGYSADRLVFLAEGEGPFLLAVGSSQERRPDYPVEAAISSLRKRFGADWQPPLAALDSARPSAGANALLEPHEPLAWKRWLLWTVLVGAAGLVGGIALSLLRTSGQGGTKDRQQPPEE